MIREKISFFLFLDDIEHCLFPVLFRLSVKDYNADDIRIESVGVSVNLINLLINYLLLLFLVK